MLADGAAASTIGQATLMPEGEPTVEITTAELRQILAEQSAYLFDARVYLEYAISHIPGSLTVAARVWEMGVQRADAIARIEAVVPDKRAPLVIYGNGLYCEQSKGLAEALLVAGFRNVRRYQLGIPIWRALGGVTAMEVAGAHYVLTHDQTALWIDVRQPAAFVAGSLAGAIDLSLKLDALQARQWLARQDHNTRLIVFGGDEGQVRGVAEAMVRLAFHNVSYLVVHKGEKMQPKQNLSEKDNWDKVIERATTDAAYRQRLIADPRKTLSEAGIDVPEDVEVRVREFRNHTRYLFLPPMSS